MGQFIDYLNRDFGGMSLPHAAVHYFIRPQSMAAFYQEYVNRIRAWAKTPEERKHPEKVARRNLLEVLIAQDSAKLNAWKSAVPELQTPLERLVHELNRNYMNRPPYNRPGAHYGTFS